MYLIFDTETTGLPKNWNAPLTDFNNWPRMVQLAWQIHGSDGSFLSSKNLIVKPEGYEIPYNAQKIHGISTERALKEGDDLVEVLDQFLSDVKSVSFIIGHNIEFDNNIVGRTTSGNFSFCFNKNLSFGYIQANKLEELKNEKVYIEVEKKKYLARILDKPLNQKNFKI